METTTATETKERSAKQIARSKALLEAKQAKLMARAVRSLTGPLKIGDRAMCGYWRASYTLIAINPPAPGFGMPSITVRWDARPDRAEHETTHATAWDDRRDVKLEDVP